MPFSEHLARSQCLRAKCTCFVRPLGLECAPASRLELGPGNEACSVRLARPRMAVRVRVLLLLLLLLLLVMVAGTAPWRAGACAVWRAPRQVLGPAAATTAACRGCCCCPRLRLLQLRRQLTPLLKAGGECMPQGHQLRVPRACLRKAHMHTPAFLPGVHTSSQCTSCNAGLHRLTACGLCTASKGHQL